MVTLLIQSSNAGRGRNGDWPSLISISVSLTRLRPAFPLIHNLIETFFFYFHFYLLNSNFILAPNSNKKIFRSPIPCSPVIGSGSMFRWKHQESGSQLKPRRGTNMRFLPLDWPPSGHTKSGKASNSPNGGSDDEPQPSAVLASTLLLSAGLLVILVMAVLIVFSVYYRPAQNKNKNHNRSSSSSETNHTSDDIKNIQTGGSGGLAAIIGVGGE